MSAGLSGLLGKEIWLIGFRAVPVDRKGSEQFTCQLFFNRSLRKMQQNVNIVAFLRLTRMLTCFKSVQPKTADSKILLRFGLPAGPVEALHGLLVT